MDKVLIANRAEIALRIIQSLRKMGITTVAVYSDADRNAPFVEMADQAVCIGPPPSSKSYLDIEKLIRVAKDLNCDAIHPGYGFLSENATFAQRVADEGITFIGPRPHSIETMGSKLKAKEAVKKFGIPLVPGTEEAVSDIENAKRIALEIGYPILIKASAGGGGKGMRIVRNPGEFESQMQRAISEAEASFGDGAVFIEKFVDSPRHIEVQILADEHDNYLHLNERECSIQRRHQKVIEEAPSSKLDAALRQKMGEAAINVAKACDYVGAGTVEFLADADNNFYFLEMNTRLQVEHPVTECITGIDLVQQQIHIAKGEPLTIRQEEVPILGHAIELRVYAEDPFDQFLPAIGNLERYRPPHGDGIRVDDGFKEGMDVPIHYDPMLAKLVVHATDRRSAIAKMKRAIDAYEVEGVSTTLPFGRFVMDHPAFIDGSYDTQFIDLHFSKKAISEYNQKEEEVAAKFALHLLRKHWKKIKPLP